MEWTVKQKPSAKKEKDPKDPEKVKTVTQKATKINTRENIDNGFVT